MPRWETRVGGHGYAWKKKGIFELFVDVTRRPPWISEDTLRHAQGTGAVLEWDLRQHPHLWPAARLWLWKVATQKSEKEQELFPMDWLKPESHLDETLDLGQVRVVKMSADVIDRYEDFEKAWVYRLTFQFSIDVAEALSGSPGTQQMHRRRLAAVLGELYPLHVTLSHAEDEELGEPTTATEQELLSASSPRSAEIVKNAFGLTVGRAKNAQEALDAANAEFGDGNIASVTIKRGRDDGTEEIVDHAGAPLADEEDDDDDDDDDGDGDYVPEPMPEATPPKRVTADDGGVVIEPKAVAKVLTAEMLIEKLIAWPSLYSFAIAQDLGVTNADVLRVADADERFEVTENTSTFKDGMCVKLVNLALQPMFDDEASEAERLEAARTDLARIAAHVLDEREKKSLPFHDLQFEVTRRARSGNVESMLWMALDARPKQFKMSGNVFNQVVTLKCEPSAIAKLPVPKPEPAPVPASEPTVATPICTSCNKPIEGEWHGSKLSGYVCDPCEQAAIANMIAKGSGKTPEIKAAEVAELHRRIVGNLRDRTFNAAAYMVAQSIDSTTEDVVRHCETHPEAFTVQLQSGTPTRVVLVADPTRDELAAFVQEEVRSEVHAAGHVSKATLARRIADKWKLRPSAAEGWLTLALMHKPGMFVVGKGGVQLAA